MSENVSSVENTTDMSQGLTFGQLLKKVLDQQGLLQADLVKLSDKNSGYISTLCQGPLKKDKSLANVTTDTADYFSKLLKIPPQLFRSAINVVGERALKDKSKQPKALQLLQKAKDLSRQTESASPVPPSLPSPTSVTSIPHWEVTKEQIERISLVGPMEDIDHAERLLRSSGFIPTSRGPYTDVSMFPKHDYTRFLCTGERIISTT